MQERLLTLAALIAPPGERPNLAYLERRAGLKTGTLKDSGRRGSVSKAVAAALLRVAPRLGIAGLTTDWLVLERGDPPHKSGELPGDRSSRPQRAGKTPSYGDAEGKPKMIRDRAVTATADGAEGQAYKPDMRFDSASVLAVLERMPEEMQRAAIAEAFARGINHQELHGSGLLRVARGLCLELRRMGFAGVAKEIESEMMRAVFAEIPEERPPEPPVDES